LRTSDTVVWETRASLATSIIVGRRAGAGRRARLRLASRGPALPSAPSSSLILALSVCLRILLSQQMIDFQSQIRCAEDRVQRPIDIL
jgi:hypothetical protein